MGTTEVQSAILGSFVADTIALGPHWIYDQDEIQQKFANLKGPVSPLPGSYHPQKKAGELTHYGDQAKVLLECIKEKQEYDHSYFAQKWEAMWNGYNDYVDGATKGTLTNMAAGNQQTASSSHDLAGASRVAPLLLLCLAENELVSVARQQTLLTHGDTRVADAAEFFIRLTKRVLAGETINTAIDGLEKLSLDALDVSLERKKAKAQSGKTAGEALKALGLSCDVGVAFAGCIFLIENYPNDFQGAILENALAGGDSAARGMLVGMVLGAANPEQIPEHWIPMDISF